MDINYFRSLNEKELKRLNFKEYNYNLILENNFLIFKCYINRALDNSNKENLIKDYLENTINDFLDNIKDNVKILYLIDTSNVHFNKVYDLIEFNKELYQKIKNFALLIKEAIDTNNYHSLYSCLREEKEEYGNNVCTMCGKKFNFFDEQEDFSFDKMIGYPSYYDYDRIQFKLCVKCFDDIMHSISPLFLHNVVSK